MGSYGRDLRRSRISVRRTWSGVGPGGIDDDVLERFDLLRAVVFEQLEILRVQVLDRNTALRRVDVHAYEVRLGAELGGRLRRSQLDLYPRYDHIQITGCAK